MGFIATLVNFYGVSLQNRHININTHLFTSWLEIAVKYKVLCLDIDIEVVIDTARSYIKVLLLIRCIYLVLK